MSRDTPPPGHLNITDPTTNAFPHAKWWEDTGPEDRVWGINPSAALLGYFLRVAVSADFTERLVRDIDVHLERDPAKGSDDAVRPSTVFSWTKRVFRVPQPMTRQPT